MKKRLFSILLCIVVCMAMMPLGVYGAKYTITVGGEVININTKVEYDITNNITIKKEGGYVKYNDQKKTLTIKDAEVKGKIKFGDSQSYTIIVEGDSYINVTDDAGIIDTLGRLTIKGGEDGGKLTVTGSLGIKFNILTFENIEAVVTGNSNHGIYCDEGNGNIEIKNSKITAQGAESFKGIHTRGSIFAKDAVDGNGEAVSRTEEGYIGNCYDGTINNKIDKYGIWVAGNQVTSRNAGDVLGDKTVSYDFDAKTLTINNANISGSYSQPEGYTGYKN